MKSFKATVFLSNLVIEDESDPESVKDAVKDALALALDLDEAGDEDLEFQIEEDDDEYN